MEVFQLWSMFHPTEWGYHVLLGTFSSGSKVNGLPARQFRIEGRFDSDVINEVDKECFFSGVEREVLKRYKG